MTEDEQRDLSRTARFLPQTDPDTAPCIEVGGVQVYAFITEGELRISVHYDEADPRLLTDDDTVPTRVYLGDTEVYAAN